MATEERKRFGSVSPDSKDDKPEGKNESLKYSILKKSLVVGTPRAFGVTFSQEGGLDDDEPSQVTLSQTDEQIRQLESDGALKHVVGSQSVLSQELLDSSQRDEEDEEPEEGGQYSQFEYSENSIAMAQRLGLLSQEPGIMPPRYDATPSKAAMTIECNTSHASPFGTSEYVEPAAVGYSVGVKSEPVTSSGTTAATTKRRVPRLKGASARENECFGSLLDAVQAISEQEELYALHHTNNTSDKKASGAVDSPSNSSSSSGSSTKTGESAKRKAPPKESAEDEEDQSASSGAKKPRKASTKKAKESEQRNAQEIAKRAAALAEQTVADPEMAKKLLLSMALVRENPRTLPSTWPPRGSVVPEGFFWAHYPPLEGVLKKHMAEYYELSTTKCQSAQQQAFNNELVVLVREVSKQQGWKFNKSFSDKSLRDRIRCYYKTHIQNAKKRLRTMVRNPTKKANARHLCAHLDLIEKYNSSPKGSKRSKNEKKIGEVKKPAVEDSKVKTKPPKKKTTKEQTSKEKVTPSPVKSSGKIKTATTRGRAKSPAKKPTVDV